MVSPIRIFVSWHCFGCMMRRRRSATGSGSSSRRRISTGSRRSPPIEVHIGSIAISYPMMRFVALITFVMFWRRSVRLAIFATFSIRGHYRGRCCSVQTTADLTRGWWYWHSRIGTDLALSSVRVLQKIIVTFLCSNLSLFDFVAVLYLSSANLSPSRLRWGCHSCCQRPRAFDDYVDCDVSICKNRSAKS